MILYNVNVYTDGLIRKGVLLINKGLIQLVKFNLSEKDYKDLVKKNEDNKEIDCQSKLVLPGIIDIHSHLRDMEQSEKETFLTGTKAAAFSGITTVFNMPNTKPPAINLEQIKKWIEKAENNIYVNVGFIAGVPKGIDEDEIKRIIDLGVIGFKIYPLDSLNEIDWKNPRNIQSILTISSRFSIPIFIHADWSISDSEKYIKVEEFKSKGKNVLELHNKLHPVNMEEKYVKFIIDQYKKTITTNKLTPEKYPIIHFCHISCKNSYRIIKETLGSEKKFKISFEITPHHLLLSNNLNLENDNYGKVLPPLRDKKHPEFLFNELENGNIELIGTDHAPHTLEEKSKNYDSAPSGFPGFETYPLLLLNKVFQYQLSLENFVKCASENPAKKFKLKSKGFIKEGYDADLFIVEKIPEYTINSKKFKSKAKYSPFENLKTSVQIWKVFISGIEINVEAIEPIGKVIKRLL
ncbi:MAG: dihydroorotase family protein [Candidatus Hodarchaeota archaeon]